MGRPCESLTQSHLPYRFWGSQMSLDKFARTSFRGALFGASSAVLALALAQTSAQAQTVNTSQPYYDQNSASLAQSPVEFAGGTFKPTTTYALTAPVVLDVQGGTVDASNGAVSLNGVISGPGGLILSGGSVALGAVNSYTGLTTVNAGATLTLAPANYTGISASSGVADYGTLNLTGMTANTSIKTLSGNGSVIVGAHGLQLTNAADTFSGVISGTSAFLVNGGTETLTGTNTYTGGTIINNSSVLVLTGSGSIATTSSLLDDGTFDISGTTSGASIKALSGQAQGSVLLGSKTLTLTGAFNTFSGVISGSGGGLTVASGTETLTGINTYTGLTTINSGAKLLLTGASFGSITASAGVLDNGTFDISGTTAVAPISSLSGNGSVLTGTQGLQLLNAADTFSGVISGAGALFVHAGTETLTGTNTYTNRTVIGSGAVLALAGSGSISTSRTVTIDGTFDISGLTNGGTSIRSLGDSGSVVLGANTLTLTNAANSFNGVISGSGGLTLLGGSQPLTGTNTYTGATTISGGTLVLSGTGSIAASSGVADNAAFDISGLTTGGTNIVSLSGGGTVNLGANTLTLTSAAGDVFSGVISGAGGLTIAGGGEVLAGANTYGGLTTIAGPAGLIVGNDGATGSIAGNIVDNGLLAFNRTDAYAYSGVISGAGNVVVSIGTVGLTGAQTYSGGTFVNSSATLALTGNNTSLASSVVNLGTLDISGATSGAAIASLWGSGKVTLGAQTLTLTDMAGTIVYFTNVFSGVISGSGGLVVNGPGTMVLDGVNTFTGQTSVVSGVLEVGDAANPGAVLDSHIGGVVVGAAGTLTGHGTIKGAVTNTAGGVVAPGGTIGTLTIGSYTQGAGSTLAIEVSPSAASQLNVLGAASLNGTLALTFDAGSYGPAIYKIVAGAPVSGTFGTVTQAGLASNLVQGIYYKPSGAEVDLAVEPKSSAQSFATLSTATLDEAQSFAGIVSDRQDDAGCPVGAKAGKAGCDGAAVWGQALDRRAHTDGLGVIAAANDISDGFIAGVDTRLPGGAAGVAVAYTQNTLTMNAATTRATGRSVFASAYGRLSRGGFEFDAQAFYMDSAWTQSRTVGAYGVASSRPNGTTGGGVVQVAYPLLDGQVKPYVKVSYADFNRDATTETTSQVGPLALAVASGSNTSARGELGVKFATTATADNGVTMSPELRLGLSQDFGANGRDVQARLALAPSVTFVSAGVTPAQTAGVVAAALRVKLSDQFDLYGDLRGRFSRDQSESAISLGGHYRF